MNRNGPIRKPGGRSLADLQKEFAAMLHSTKPPRGRLGIYHNNMRANFGKALALAYPVTERIVGTDFFGSLADDFRARQPSRSGDLHHAGRGFADFLAGGFASPGAPYEYLADLARLEWAWAEALVGADATAAGIEAIAEHPPEHWPGLEFALHPTVTLLASPWPIHTLFDEHRRPEPAVVRLDMGGECVAVVRNLLQVTAHRLSAAEYALWCALRDGLSLEQALDRMGEQAPTIDLSGALQRLFGSGAVCAVTTP